MNKKPIIKISNTYLLQFNKLIVSFALIISCSVCLGTVNAAIIKSVTEDSLAYFTELLEHPEDPDDFEKARRWLNRYYRSLVNYDESHVPDLDLPDPLLTLGKQPVRDKRKWKEARRAEILHLFEQHVYGRFPDFEYETEYIIRSIEKDALRGNATRKQVAIILDKNRPELHIDILLYIPNHVARPVPAFMGLNFYGNQTVHADDGIRMSEKWMRPNEDIGIKNNRATEQTRGVYAERWQIEKVIESGYAVVTAYCGDIEPDNYRMSSQGVRSLANDVGIQPVADEWGTIAAWAWGLGRMLDYLGTDNDINHEKVAVIGHSRLGKAALWAGATDQRFAGVVSNNSGLGGAALSRRKFGETVAVINTSFPHWFAGNFSVFNENESELPVDQHMLLSLVAPRPLYVASAKEDHWADPKGEFLSALHADPVYKLYGLGGLPVSIIPVIDQPVMGTIGYHIRSGGHAITAYDWERYITFFNCHFMVCY
jgi:hypothetical protein